MLRRIADVLDVKPWDLTTVDPSCARLSDLRTWAGYSQAELARALGVPETSLSAVERGTRPLKDALAERLAAFLGLSTDEVRRAYLSSRGKDEQ